jgi:PPOX class probable F420-dependent enzyme
MTLSPTTLQRLSNDHVVWLTTVSDSGGPNPNPVWCAPDGDDVVIFTTAGSVRVHNIEQRPRVALNFNSDELGGDVLVIAGTATVTRGARPSHAVAYREKYEAAMRDLHQMSLADFDATFDVEIRVRPERVRGG